MNIKKTLKGLENFRNNLLLPRDFRVEHRKTAMNTKLGKITIDTICALDTKEWETGIKKEVEWIIVEQYKNMKEATKGHTKWVEKLKNNPKIKLKDIDMWGLDEN